MTSYERSPAHDWLVRHEGQIQGEVIALWDSFIDSDTAQLPIDAVAVLAAASHDILDAAIGAIIELNPDSSVGIVKDDVVKVMERANTWIGVS